VGILKASMANIGTMMEAAYKAQRGTLGARRVRLGSVEYVGTPAAPEPKGANPGAVSAIGTAEGAVRLLVSELTKPYPTAMDARPFEVYDDLTGEWVARTILAVDPGQTGKTLLVRYGVTSA